MGFSQDFGAGRVTNVKPKKGFSLKDVYGDGTPKAQFFSPSGNEVGQIASATTDLSGLSEDQNYKAYMKEQGIRYPRTLPSMFHQLNRENMRQDIQEGRFKDGQFFNKAPENTDTKIAMGDNLGGYAAAIGGLGSMAIMTEKRYV